jgi:hypothetical protein
MPEGKLLKKASLEERIKRILLMPELEMDGNAYKGKYELNDVKSIRDFILNELRKSYTNQNTGDEIIISRNSAKEIAGHYSDSEAYQKSIAHIPQIIENMLFLEKRKAEEEGAKFDEYLYYITSIKIDGKPHTILSTAGYKLKQGKVYYVQNVFEGTPKEVFAKAKNEVNIKYKRLNEILNEKRQLEPIPDQNQRVPTASNSKYNNFSEKKQG